MKELDDSPREECGIIGVFAPNEDVARMTFFGLFALQHRGQEAAGMAVADGQTISLYKNVGLVSQVFRAGTLDELRGHYAIGHTRYSTTGSSLLRNAQPFMIETMHGPLALGHNGNLVNSAALRAEMLRQGVGFSSSSDSEVMTMMLARDAGPTWEARIKDAMKKWVGAYSLVILTRDCVYAVRDPWGFRPLSVGMLPNGGYAVASETGALRTLGCEAIRDVQPGEIVALSANALTVTQALPPVRPSAKCVFEHIYFARPDQTWEGVGVHAVRQRLGEELAREWNNGREAELDNGRSGETELDNGGSGETERNGVGSGRSGEAELDNGESGETERNGVGSGRSGEAELDNGGSGETERNGVGSGRSAEAELDNGGSGETERNGVGSGRSGEAELDNGESRETERNGVGSGRSGEAELDNGRSGETERNGVGSGRSGEAELDNGGSRETERNGVGSGRSGEAELDNGRSGETERNGVGSGRSGTADINGVDSGRNREADARRLADVVIPVPDSSIPAAIGFSRVSGIPYNDGFVKNRYVGRTFIEPTDSLRKRGVGMKFNVISENVRDKRVIVIDDSIVRGNTTGPLIKLLRQAGAKEVHMCITCPPIAHPCFMGVDMGGYEDLIAHNRTVEEIRRKVGADSLTYLSLEGMMRAVGSAEGYCQACFTGKYPVPVDLTSVKTGFERGTK